MVDPLLVLHLFIHHSLGLNPPLESGEPQFLPQQDSARGGSRTRTARKGQGGLSPPRLPISPPGHRGDQFSQFACRMNSYLQKIPVKVKFALNRHFCSNHATINPYGTGEPRREYNFHTAKHNSAHQSEQWGRVG